MKYNKKKLYSILGAEKFQKVVFFLEREKYKILDTFFPNMKAWYERQLNKQFVKRIKKEPIKDKKALLNEYQNQKLAFRKELVYKQNRNYHYNSNYPTRFVKYLEWNKKIHMRGMKKDALILTGIGFATLVLGNPMPILSLTFTLSSLFSFFINFECVNLQNYNLYRFQNGKTYSVLEKAEKKQIEDNLKKLGSSIEKVSNAITNNIELPTIDQVVEQITTVEQAKQLMEYVKKQNVYLENSKHSIQKEKRKI